MKRQNQPTERQQGIVDLLLALQTLAAGDEPTTMTIGHKPPDVHLFEDDEVRP
jgi:hypothetical protein